MTVETAYDYRATIVRWVDGDTVDMTIDLGFHISITERFRLLGVDTPERGKPGAKEAHDFVEATMPAGSLVRAVTTKQDKYGRWLATVYPPGGGEAINVQLVPRFARGYWGGTKDAS